MNAGTFSLIPLEVIQDHRLSSIDLRVLCALFSWRDKSTNICAMTRKQIGERCGYSEQTVSRATHRLEQLGWLTKAGKGGRGMAVRYVVSVPETVSSPETVSEQETVSSPDTTTVSDPDTVSPLNGVRSGHTQRNNTETVKKQTRANRATHLPEDWSLPDAWRQEAESLAQKMGISVDVDLEADKFRDYWHSASGQKARKANWLATWRNWIRNKKEFGGRSQPPAPQQQVINDGY